MSGSSASEAALLWDESFLWGIMAFRALKASGIPFGVITAEEIRQGRLRDCRLLFVPGGWASNKLKALGEEGAAEIRRFVSEGGSYLGFCGGAGLSTQDGLGLVSVKRMPTKQRVPSFSGRINLNLNDHPLWNDIHASPVFHAWWPSQFLIDDPAVRILATYGDPLPDAFSSDLNVGDMEKTTGWESLEEKYRINLDP
ncbi:MAG: BPL-N domain-containing protein, partial [Thermodesulfovibrionales bacterium]